jgi:hypothetical protein
MAGAERCAIALDQPFEAIAGHQRRTAGGPREQDPGLLERLPHTGDARHRVFRLGTFGQAGIGIAGIHPTAGKHEHARHEAAVAMPRRHEHLDAVGTVAQQQDGGGGAGRRGRICRRGG